MTSSVVRDFAFNAYCKDTQSAFENLGISARLARFKGALTIADLDKAILLIQSTSQSNAVSWP